MENKAKLIMKKFEKRKVNTIKKLLNNKSRYSFQPLHCAKKIKGDKRTAIKNVEMSTLIQRNFIIINNFKT